MTRTVRINSNLELAENSFQDSIEFVKAREALQRACHKDIYDDYTRKNSSNYGNREKVTINTSSNFIVAPCVNIITDATWCAILGLRTRCSIRKVAFSAIAVIETAALVKVFDFTNFLWTGDDGLLPCVLEKFFRLCGIFSLADDGGEYSDDDEDEQDQKGHGDVDDFEARADTFAGEGDETRHCG